MVQGRHRVLKWAPGDQTFINFQGPVARRRDIAVLCQSEPGPGWGIVSTLAGPTLDPQRGRRCRRMCGRAGGMEQQIAAPALRRLEAGIAFERAYADLGVLARRRGSMRSTPRSSGWSSRGLPDSGSMARAPGTIDPNLQSVGPSPGTGNVDGRKAADLIYLFNSRGWSS